MRRTSLLLALPLLLAACGSQAAAVRHAPSGPAGARRSLASAGAQGVTGFVLPPAFVAGAWDPNSDNVDQATGTLLLRGQPVAGARIRVDRYVIPTPTDVRGRFVYPADSTFVDRHIVSVVDLGHATAGGAAVSQADRAALLRAHGAISVAFKLSGLHVVRSGGTLRISGRVTFANGSPPPAASLYSYRLAGRITDSQGRPVQGAVVSTRTQDRDYWTVSAPSRSDGSYTSLFTASSDTPGNPVPFSVRIAVGNSLYEFLPQENVLFQRLKSARMDIQLPPTDYPMALPQPRSFPGAIYQGTIVGAVGPTGAPLRPLAARWLDAHGRFELTLPGTAGGQTVQLWEGQPTLFSVAPAAPGGAIDLRDWPATLDPSWPQGVARLRLPR